MMDGSDAGLRAISQGVDAPGWVSWTEAQSETLTALYDVQGLSLKQIASQLGRSVHAISMRLARMRSEGRIKTWRSGRSWSDEQIAKLSAQWGKVDPAVLAADLGVTRRAAQVMASRLRLAPRRSGRAPGGDGAVPKPKCKPAPRSKRVAAKAPQAKRVAEQKSEPQLARPAAAVPPVAAMPDPAPFQMPKGAGLLSVPLRGADYGRAPVLIMPGMTDRQKAEAVAAHVAGLLPEPAFSPSDDLALCEAILAGRGLAVAAAIVRLPEADVLARFNAIVAPMRHPDIRGLPIEAAAWVLPPLRARAAEVAE